MCLNVGIFSYISDTSTMENRTSRMSILTGIFGFGSIIGIQIGGNVTNYSAIFIAAASLGIIGICYTVFVLEESLDKSLLTDGKQSVLSQVIGCFKTTIKKRPCRDRIMLFINLFQFMCFMLCINTNEFDYLMTRLKFSWTRKDFSNFMTVKGCIRIAG